MVSAPRSTHTTCSTIGGIMCCCGHSSALNTTDIGLFRTDECLASELIGSDVYTSWPISIYTIHHDSYRGVNDGLYSPLRSH
ncbi:hypothetical protein GDO78_019205 [Eleutherodactylus coqui]|uniref:Uncharacterized protein n=1 Tax=Eleutherodactylus coqui TaxID=57060 RepID=A0A8J6B842_ELECQ|nr:hypothetical protein GDO78_019205 [Eleutherodactylus coqui]